jgi:hypothetical protein
VRISRAVGRPQPGRYVRDVTGGSERGLGAANLPKIVRVCAGDTFLPAPRRGGHGSRAWRGAEIPAANGTGNARAMATILAVLTCGGVAAGRRLLSEAGCRRAVEVPGRGPRPHPGPAAALRPRLRRVHRMMPNPNTLYRGGLGGSLVIVDLDARTTFA